MVSSRCIARAVAAEVTRRKCFCAEIRLLTSAATILELTLLSSRAGRFTDSPIHRRQLPFAFQPQLATGGIDVVALFPTQRRGHGLLFQRGEEGFLRVF